LSVVHSADADCIASLGIPIFELSRHRSRNDVPPSGVYGNGHHSHVTL